MFSRSFFLFLCLCCACICAKLCRSVDVRNEVQQFDKLRNCTKIVGYLKIVLFQKDGVNFPSFPELREVTGFLMVFNANFLQDLGSLFPNLVVIRGRKLFKGTALILHHNHKLKKINLPNLREIQRGNVHIGKCPELCYVRTVNWTALGTYLSPYANVPECKTEETCDPICEGHCWAPGRCQKIYEDCHPECLGCEKPNSPKHCLACKNWRDGDTCVNKCPQDTFLSETAMECVTKQECHDFKKTFNMTGWVFNGLCLREYTCPVNYELVTVPEKTCRLCDGPCYKKCKGTSVSSKQEMQKLEGCTHIEGHLEIKVKHEYEVDYLDHYLFNITEIDGCLKVARAAVTSLNFLRNLKHIGGLKKQNMCNNHTVYIFENVNLKSLIEIDHIQTENDISIGFHNNPELCLSEIEKFASSLGISQAKFERILQQEKDVSPYSNGYRATCFKLELNVTIQKSAPTNLTLKWEPYNLNNATVIAYTFFYILNETMHQEKNFNYDNNMCNDNGWRSYLISNSNLSITDLLPFSTYAYWIKVYFIENNRAVSGSTDMKYFETIPDDPTPPLEFVVEALSPTSIEIKWESPESTNGALSHYELSASIEEDDVKFVNQRNYCIYPHVANKVEKTNNKSVKTWVNETMNGACTCKPYILNIDSFCGPRYGERSYNTKDCNNFMYDLIESPKKTKSKRYILQSKTRRFRDSDKIFEIPANNTEFIVKNLRPFSNYLFWFSACNEKFRGQSLCSAVLFASTRTLANVSADQVTNVNVKIFTDNTISVTWQDPQSPNGMIVAYNIEYKNTDSSKSTNVPDCITRTQHINSGFVYRIENIEPGAYKLRVKPVSLYGAGVYSERVTFQIRTPLKSWVIYLIICIIITIMSTSLILYFWYKHKTKLERIYLIPSINPDYSRAIYIEEGWELERDDVDMKELLGQGSFGVVYSGFVKSKNLPCAVKTVNSTAAAGYRTEFLKEAFVMKSFNDAHHVIKLYGVVSKDDPPLVIMELMERGDLKEYLRNARKNPKAISLPEMYQMAAQIADGMAYLSAKKFVHRDLAARNCMVAGDRTVKIGDFGMTKDIYETDYYRKGTNGLLPVRWMAPESLADGVFSTESDVWSYGIVLWEMVTLAEHPYQGMSNEQVLKFVTTRGRLSRPKDCPNVLWEIMEVCWQHASYRRPLFIGIVEKMEPLVGQSFALVSFYHSQAGHNYRMNYGRQESVETAVNHYPHQNSYLQEGDGDTLIDDAYDDDNDENFASRPRNRIVRPGSLTWQSSYSISDPTP